MRSDSNPIKLVRPTQGNRPGEARLGELLVREGLISERQLDEATRAQQSRTSYRLLGEVCVMFGFVARSQVRGVIEKYRKQIALGELLVRMDMVSPEQVCEALAEQERIGKRLGEILRHRCCITRADLAEALSIQLGIQNIVPSPYMVDPLLLAHVTPDFLMRNRLVPLSRTVSADNNREFVTVLMEDPLDLRTIAHLGEVFRADIEPVVSATLDLGEFLGEICESWGCYGVRGGALREGRGSPDQTFRVAFRPPAQTNPLTYRAQRSGPTPTGSGNRHKPEGTVRLLHILTLG